MILGRLSALVLVDAVLALQASGCYSPNLSANDCQYMCGPQDSCPSGLVCSTEHYCRPEGATDKCSPAASTKDMTSFGFLSAANPTIVADTNGTITGTDISATARFANNVHALVPTFSSTGETVTVGGITQISGVTANDFTNPVIYRVTAADQTTNDYSVTVTAPSFSASTDIAAGSSPESVAVVDLNLDGNPDLAVANLDATVNSVSVLLATTPAGATAPTFAARAPFATGISPRSVQFGNFNGDTLLDLAVVNSDASDSTVSILDNLTVMPAFAMFGSKVDSASGSKPTSVVAGDFNGDHLSDVAVANFGADTISVFLRTQAGAAFSFSTKVDLPALTPFFIASGDLNGDGNPDLAVANYGSNSVSVFLSTTFPGQTNATFMDKVDVVTGSGSTPTSVAIGDINRDGKKDLVVACSGTNMLSVFLNTTPSTMGSAPTFTEHHFATDVEPLSVAIGDLDGDGDNDVIVTSSSTSPGIVSILLNTTPVAATTPSFFTRRDFATGSHPNSVATGDFNRDGKLDLAVANESSGTISILLAQ